MKERLIQEADNLEAGIYDKPLPCFGCGVGWFTFLLGFVFPPLWFYSTVLYLMNYYRKDLRERVGLAASAFAALTFSAAALITIAALLIFW